MNPLYRRAIPLFVLISFTLTAWPQEVLKGRVIDGATTEPLIGATVLVNGTGEGAMADVNGNFAFELRQPLPVTITISYAGYQSQQIEVYETSSELEISLESRQLLSEVVITAVGIQTERQAINYSVQTLKAAELLETREPNIVAAISGKVAGVQINNSSGQPGGSSTIRVRGSTSILGENSPLFVLDGMPIDNSNIGLAIQNENQIVNQSNRAVDLNANDIESITVLKGPTAAALYGIRAANGAVIVNTKKGFASDKPVVTFTTSYSVESLLRRLQPTQDKYAQGINGQYVEPGLNGSEDSWGPLLSTLTYSDVPSKWDVNGKIVSQDDPLSNGIPVNRYNNIDKFLQQGYTTDNHLSIAGGSDRANYYFSAGRFYQEGIVPTTNFFKNSVRLGAGYQASDRLHLMASINYFNTGSDNRMLPGGAPSGVMRGLINTPLNFDNSNGRANPSEDPLAYSFEDGTQRAYPGGNRGFDNPYWSLNKNPHSDDINRFVIVQESQYGLTDWLTATLRLGTDFSNERRKGAFSKGSIAFPAGVIVDYGFSRRDINTDLYLTANRQINPNLNITVVAGHNFFDYHRFNTVTRGNNLSIPDFYNISNASSVTADQSTFRKKLVAVYGDVQLNYKNWLFVEVAGRNEWTSTLPVGRNSFFYPSINAGLVLSEALDIPLNSLSHLKLRVSFAQVGNDAAPYSLDTYYSTTTIGGAAQGQEFTFPYRGLSGFSLDNSKVNPDLKPETITAYEGGVDAWFLNDRIGIEFTWYKSESRDQILPISIPTSTGFNGYITNAGLITNQGIEAVVSAALVRRESLRWDVSLNFAKNKSEVVELAEGLSQIGLWNTNNVTASIIAGYPFSVFYGTRLLTDDEGNVVIDDRATIGGSPNANYGFPMVDPDQTVIGDPNPLWNLGLRNSITYKSFTLSFLFDSRYKFDIYNSAHAQMVTNGVSKITEDRYDPFVFEGVKFSDGGINDIEVIKGERWYRSTIQYPELYVEKDLWWIRLRDVNLTWNVPKAWIQRFSLEGLSITLTGRNLFLSTNYSGQDPDVNLRGGYTNGYGADFFNYPTSKSVGARLQVTF
ncbi:MAG: SusC/RagA family TonB-linked outer membrane protein [Bacteroidota bacterium]|jgi:TonB-linked SusC/RagA family outer membrane protein|nr:MAG: hypothetical protein DIU61_04200 [Bacteroidota bacterium]